MKVDHKNSMQVTVMKTGTRHNENPGEPAHKTLSVFLLFCEEYADFKKNYSINRKSDS